MANFWPFSKWSYFSNSRVFFKPLFAYNNSSVIVESFLIVFEIFIFWFKVAFLSKSTAFASRPILAVSKMF